MAPRHCHLCGRQLKDSFLTYTVTQQSAQMTLIVCSDCQANAARCRLCGRPMAERLAQDGVCAVCLATYQRCHACGMPVRDGIEMQDGSSRIFCTACAQSLPACLACQAPVDGRGSRLRDGRFRCRLCNATAIDQAAQAQALYSEVLTIAKEHLGLELGVATALVPVDAEQLAVVLQKMGGASPTEQRSPRGVYARKGMRRAIYVELGLPRVQMIGVIAHELGHAWQAERKPLLDDPLLVEGFAEWVAFRVLGILGESSAKNAMIGRSDIYGQGLRQVLGWQLDDPTAVLDRSGR